jgi:hypothetical protein
VLCVRVLDARNAAEVLGTASRSQATESKRHRQSGRKFGGAVMPSDSY